MSHTFKPTARSILRNFDDGNVHLHSIRVIRDEGKEKKRRLRKVSRRRRRMRKGKKKGKKEAEEKKKGKRK